MRRKKIAHISISPPSILETKTYQDQAAEGTYDLIIYDQCAPKEMPACNTLFIGSLPAKDNLSAEKQPGGSPADTTVVENATPTTPGWTATEKQGLPVVIDVNQVHPLTQLVQMGNVKIGYGRGLKGPPGTVTLIDSDAGVLYSVGPPRRLRRRGSRLRYRDQRRGRQEILQHRLAHSSQLSRLHYERLEISRWHPRQPRLAEYSPRFASRPPHCDSRKINHGHPAPRRPLRNPTRAANTFVFSRTDELGVYEVREGSGNKVSHNSP